MIASLICFYNHERIQLATKMTSMEVRFGTAAWLVSKIIV